MNVQVALCGLPPAEVRQIATWLAQRPGLGLTVSDAADSPEGLLQQLATRPAHCVVLDAGLGPGALSLARALREAGYPAVCVIGDRPDLHPWAEESGVALCPDYRPERVADELRRLLGLPADAAPAAQVLACFSPRGGAGTTTLLLSLAHLLGGAGRNIVIVETGGCGGLVPFLGLRPAGSWGDIAPDAARLTPGVTGPELLSRALIEVRPGLHLLASGGPAAMDQLAAEDVEALLHLLPGCGFDTILIDTGAEVTLPTATALTLAQRICLLALPDVVSAFRLARVHELLAALRIPADRIFPVINRAREPVPPQLLEVLRFLGLRPPVRIPEESRPPVDPSGRFVGFRQGSGAAVAVRTLLESLMLEVSPA